MENILRLAIRAANRAGFGPQLAADILLRRVAEKLCEISPEIKNKIKPQAITRDGTLKIAIRDSSPTKIIRENEKILLKISGAKRVRVVMANF